MQSIEWTEQLRFLVALALGFLVGLERESTKGKQKKVILGGIRTYPIISLMGFGCAWLYKIGVEAILPIGLVAISALTVISYFSKSQYDKYGITSEVSALVTFVIGALALLVDIWASMALGIISTILLSEKARLEFYVDRLDRVEFLAVLKFLLVTLIILPVLPDKNYTQFNINPYKTWQIVIIVSTVGFVGYIISKRLGAHAGFRVSGLVGGIVSSTAVSIAYGRMAQKNENLWHPALQGALVASSVMYIRVLVLISIINSAVVEYVWLQLTFLSLVGFIISFINGNKPATKKSIIDQEIQNLQNPFEIRPAILFAVLFLGLSVITGLVKNYFGSSGIITLSAIVGITDIDPFILSLVSGDVFGARIIAVSILIAMMSNSIIKGIYFGTMVKQARKDVIVRFGLLAILHIPVIVMTLFNLKDYVS